MSFTFILDIVTLGSPIVLILGLYFSWRFWSILNETYKLITLYFGLCLAIDLLSRILAETNGNNLILIPLFGLFELILFAYLYLKIFHLQKRVWPLYLVILAGSLIVWDVVMVVQATTSEFQSYGRVIDGFILIILSTVYYLDQLTTDDAPQTDRIVLNGGILVFFSLNLLFFLPINFLVNVESIVKFYFWMANFALTVVFYSFLIFRLWKYGRTQQQLRHG